MSWGQTQARLNRKRFRWTGKMETESHLADGSENGGKPLLSLNIPAEDAGKDKGFSLVRRRRRKSTGLPKNRPRIQESRPSPG